MYSLAVKDHIFIAHSLPGEVFGLAQNLHGATYIVEAEFKRETIDENNIVFDIGLASGVLRDVLAGLNYKNLDDLEEFASRLTTVEFLSKHIHDQVSARIAPFFKGWLKVTLQESPVARASYEAEVV